MWAQPDGLTTHARTHWLVEPLAGFCSLLINCLVGINSCWPSTIDNLMTDEFSWLCQLHKNSNNSSQSFDLDYNSLLQKYLQLQKCMRFVPRNELISCIKHCLSTRSCPSLEGMKKLRLSRVGKLTSSIGWGLIGFGILAVALMLNHEPWRFIIRAWS